MALFAMGLSVTAWAQTPGAAPCVLSMRWADDPPYFMRGPDGQVRGVRFELTQEALRRMGCQFKLVELPWARALIELEAGRLDMLPGALRRPEREVYAHFSKPLQRSPNVLFAHVDAPLDPRARRLTDIAATGFRLGVQIGVSYGPDFVALSADPAFVDRLQKLTSRRSLWQMMALRRIDGVIADEATGRYELRELGLTEQIRQTAVVVSDEPALVMFSKRTVSAEFVSRFDAVIAEMERDGSLAAVLWRYLGPEPGELTPGARALRAAGAASGRAPRR